MSKFYSTEPSSGSSENRGAVEGRLIWMMTGVLFTVLIMLLVYIYHSPATSTLPTTAQSNTDAATPSGQATYNGGEIFPQHSSPSSPPPPSASITSTPTQKPHFTFYKELSDSPSTQEVIEPLTQKQAEQEPVNHNTLIEASNQDAITTIPQPDMAQKSTVQQQDAVEQKTDGPSLTANHYLLQTGSFKSQLQADRQRAELLLQGYNAGIRSVKLSSGHTWHRVVLGPFNKKQAASVQARLNSDHIQSQLRKAN